MIQETLKEQLFDKIPQDAKIVFFGAGEIAQKMYKDIQAKRKDVKVLGFIENNIKVKSNLPLWTLKEFVESDTDVDLVVFSTRNNVKNMYNILDVYDIPFLPQTEFVSRYYRGKTISIFSDENYNKLVAMFSDEEDSNLFDIIFKLRAKVTDGKNLKKYYEAKYNNSTGVFDTERIKCQYLDKINKKAIKTLIDVGTNNGNNIIAFNKMLPNLEHTFAFEAIYDIVKEPIIEDFIMNDKLTIIPYGIGDKEGKADFVVPSYWKTCSLCTDLTSMNENTSDWEHIEVNITTLDKYIFENNIKPDFIKMDIEGAELPALRGGIECIKKYRPQLAISIYHSDEDFVNIPLYLAESLKNYHFKLGHYSGWWCETVLYAIPDELA